MMTSSDFEKLEVKRGIFIRKETDGNPEFIGPFGSSSSTFLVINNIQNLLSESIKNFKDDETSPKCRISVEKQDYVERGYDVFVLNNPATKPPEEPVRQCEGTRSFDNNF